jgi:hypothetical protein
MTHSLNDWLAVVSFGIAAHAAMSVPYFLTVDADLADFDPRPALSRALESGRLDLLLIAVADAKYDARAAAETARRVPRDAAISLAALLMLCTPAATPKGALR